MEILASIGVLVQNPADWYQAYEIYQEINELNQKIVKKHQELQNAKIVPKLNPSNFSCVFKGDIKKEIDLRQLQSLKLQGFEEAKQFLESQSLLMQLNFKQLIVSFFNEENNTFDIDLKKIKSNQMIYFNDEINHTDNLFKLNQGINDISQLLFLYFQGLYAKENAITQFQFMQEEIINHIYKIVSQRAESANNESYKILLKKLDYYSESQLKNDKIKQLCLNLKERNLSKKEGSQRILTHFKNVYDELRQSSIQLYTFELANAILNIHYKKIFNFHNKAIIENQILYLQLDESQLVFYYEMIELRFVEYLQTKQFFGGLDLEIINLNLQFLILSIDWRINEAFEESVIFILNYLSRFNYSVLKSQSSIRLKKQENQGIPQMLYMFTQKFEQQIKDAKAWWIDNMHDAKNIKVIFQLYIIVANIQFVNDFLQIGVYSPINRLALIQILEVLNGNNNKNLVILNFCEIITHKIQLQLQDQLEDENNKININIQLNNHKIYLMLFEEQKDTTILLRSRESFFFNILKPISKDGVIDQKLAKNQSQQIKQRLQLMPYQDPCFNFEVISRSESNSNVITLLITGLLKKNTSRAKVWENCNKIGPGPGTILALHCESLSYADLGINFSDLLDLINGTLPTSILILKKLSYQNQFIEAENRAKNIASQLAQLIINDNLFRDRQINIIVHSLGSVILRRLIELLDQNMDPSKQFINDILIMGGIEDIDLLAKLRWNQVAGRVFNIYSQTDQELKNIQIYTEQKQSPCGLQSIPFMYKQIINHDLTYLIEKHNNYSENLATIFRLIGFNNDYIPFLKDY